MTFLGILKLLALMAFLWGLNEHWEAQANNRNWKNLYRDIVQRSDTTQVIQTDTLINQEISRHGTRRQERRRRAQK